MLFETRYFLARFATKERGELDRFRSILYRAGERRLASIVTIYEVYKISIEQEGEAVARIRTDAIQREFEIIGIDDAVATEAARLGAKLRIPMADSLIMATAKILRVPCVTDDPHYSEVKRIWI